MKVIIGNQEVNLVPDEIVASKKMISRFMKMAKDKSVETGHPTFYFTTLILMHLMSKDQIDALSTDAMQTILNAYFKNYEQSVEKE